ncbi:hypothetical protein OSTOST_03878, partial [Ostertagia ostertagi]
MQHRAWNAPDGADEPEVPVLRGVLPMFPVPPPPIRPANPPPARNLRRGAARLRAESPDTAVEYDQNEVDALKRMKDGADEPEVPVLRGVLPMFPVPPPPIRPANPPPRILLEAPLAYSDSNAQQTLTTHFVRLRRNPRTQLEYHDEVNDSSGSAEKLKEVTYEGNGSSHKIDRERKIADRQINGLSLIGESKQNKSFVVVNDDVRAVREAEERYLMKEMEAHIKLIEKGTKNLLTDIEARQADLTSEMEHVES